LYRGCIAHVARSDTHEQPASALLIAQRPTKRSAKEAVYVPHRSCDHR
jgi:hypothetical protein